jgi:hypothetical protein
MVLESPIDPVMTTADNAFQVVNPLTIHATVYGLGDQNEVNGLCELAKERIESCLNHHANSDDFVSAV